MADTEHYGPALPPATQSEGVSVSIGPALPPGFVKQEASSSPAQMEEGNTQTSTSDSVQGGDSGTGGEGSMAEIGPMVSEMSHGDEVVQAAEEFERRSRKMKDHLTVKAEAEPGPSKREEWMTELPPEMGKSIGVTARTFSKGGGTDDKDRSDWTDTPADKVKKEKEGGKSKKRKRDEGEKNLAKQRDEQLQQQIEEYNKKKRPESLVEMHQKSKKKKKKKEEKKKKKDKKKGKEREEKKPVREAFDREKDLKVNKFDEAQRKAIIKKSAMLNTRFQHSGSTSSFL